MDIDCENKETCRVCSVPAASGCSSCNRVNYCCKDHQVKDWKNRHRNECYISVQENEDLGRHFVAQRDIKAGTVIFDEQPALIQPGMSDKKKLLLNICMGCSANCSEFCPKCTWPICSEKCTNVEHHALYECKLFQEKGVKFNGPMCGTMSSAIFIIRGVLMKKVNPKKWNGLSRYIEKFERKEWIPNKIQKDKFKDYKKTIMPYLKKLNIGKEFTDLDNLNNLAYLADFADIQMELMNSQVVYPISGLISHGCFPNCCAHYDQYTCRKITWTCIDISKGDILFINYSNILAKIGAWQLRKNCLNDKVNFNCRCPRCLDSTELGTMLSAVKCPCGGYLLPSDPQNISLNSDSKWTCSDQNCDKGLIWDQICEIVDRNKLIIEKFGSDLTKVGKAGQLGQIDFDKIDATIDNLNVIFHPNHWLILNFHEVVLLAEIDIESEEKLDFYIPKLVHLSELYNLIYPGNNTSKLAVLQIFEFTLKKKLMGLEEFEDEGDGELDEEKYNLMEHLKIVLEQLIEIKKVDPANKNPQGIKSVQDMEKDLYNLSKYYYEPND